MVWISNEYRLDVIQIIAKHVRAFWEITEVEAMKGS